MDERDDAPPVSRRALRWDGTVTAGNLLTALALAVALLAWGLRLEARVEQQDFRQAAYERQADRMRAEDQAREAAALNEVRASLRRIEDILLGRGGRSP